MYPHISQYICTEEGRLNRREGEPENRSGMDLGEVLS